MIDRRLLLNRDDVSQLEELDLSTNSNNMIVKALYVPFALIGQGAGWMYFSVVDENGTAVSPQCWDSYNGYTTLKTDSNKGYQFGIFYTLPYSNSSTKKMTINGQNVNFYCMYIQILNTTYSMSYHCLPTLQQRGQFGFPAMADMYVKIDPNEWFSYSDTMYLKMNEYTEWSNYSNNSNIQIYYEPVD